MMSQQVASWSINQAAIWGWWTTNYLLSSCLAASGGFLIVLAVYLLRRDLTDRRELRGRLRSSRQRSRQVRKLGEQFPSAAGLTSRNWPLRWKNWRTRIRQLSRRQGERHREQWPAVLDWLSRLLRAGLTLPQALELSGTELREPLRGEFMRCYERQRLGMELTTALDELAIGLAFSEARVFAVAVRVHQETGGNLADQLDCLATVCRQRLRLRQLVDTLTSESRAQAAVLLALPVVMTGLLTIINRPYLEELLSHPGLIACSVTLMAIGTLWMRQICHAAKTS